MTSDQVPRRTDSERDKLFNSMAVIHAAGLAAEQPGSGEMRISGNGSERTPGAAYDVQKIGASGVNNHTPLQRGFCVTGIGQGSYCTNSISG